jgi:hypothetical protein
LGIPVSRQVRGCATRIGRQRRPRSGRRISARIGGPPVDAAIPIAAMARPVSGRASPARRVTTGTSAMSASVSARALAHARAPSPTQPAADNPHCSDGGETINGAPEDCPRNEGPAEPAAPNKETRLIPSGCGTWSAAAPLSSRETMSVASTTRNVWA